MLRRSQVVDHVEGWQRLNEGDEEGGQVSSKRVVILAAPADMNYDLGTKVSYKKYLKLIWWPDFIFFVSKRSVIATKRR